LQVWQKAHRLTLEVYRATDAFPREEQFGLKSQLRRSCASIPANIAEGCGRDGDAELRRFVTIAAGSASETEYHLMLSGDLGYLPKQVSDELMSQTTELKRMLYAFQRTLSADR
jgi:four helix bundle protein